MSRLKAWLDKIGREAIVRESRAEIIVLEAKVDLLIGRVEALEERMEKIYGDDVQYAHNSRMVRLEDRYDSHVQRIDKLEEQVTDLFQRVFIR